MMPAHTPLRGLDGPASSREQPPYTTTTHLRLRRGQSLRGNGPGKQMGDRTTAGVRPLLFPQQRLAIGIHRPLNQTLDTAVFQFLLFQDMLHFCLPDPDPLAFARQTCNRLRLEALGMQGWDVHAAGLPLTRKWIGSPPAAWRASDATSIWWAK